MQCNIIFLKVCLKSVQSVIRMAGKWYHFLQVLYLNRRFRLSNLGPAHFNPSNCIKVFDFYFITQDLIGNRGIQHDVMTHASRSLTANCHCDLHSKPLNQGNNFLSITSHEWPTCMHHVRKRCHAQSVYC
jgi:hypothetical protein